MNTSSPRTCLVTGGAGNLSRQLKPHLLAAGYRLVLWDIAEPPTSGLLQDCTYVQGDMTERGHVSSVMAQYRPDTVLHFATMLSGASEADRGHAWHVNMDASFYLLEEAIAHQTNRLLFLSSLAAYGAPLPNPVPEDYPQWPVGLYGVTKAAIERLGNYYHHRHGLDFRVLRLPVIVSRHAPLGASSAYPSRAYIEAAENGHYRFRVHPLVRPILLYSKDVPRAIVQLLSAPTDRLSRRVYNIQGISPTAQQLADAIEQRLPLTTFEFDPDPAVSDLIDSWPQAFVDESARRDWGWEPEYDLDSMSDDFIGELTGNAGNQ